MSKQPASSAQISQAAQSELKEVRLPLLPAKLLGPDGSVQDIDMRRWFWRCFLHAWLTSYKYSLWATIPLFLVWATCMAMAHAQYYGAAALFHPHFIFLLALGNVMALLQSTIFALVFSVLPVSPGSYTPFPEAVYLSSAGFGFGGNKNIIPWHKVQLVRTTEMIYRGMRRSNVIEIYVEKKPYVQAHPRTPKERLTDLLKIDGLKRSFHFLDTKTKKLPVNEYDSICLRVPTELFGFDADYQKFLKTLKDNLSPQVFQCTLSIEPQASSDGDSFTSVWLKDLHSPQSGSANRVLATGHSLHNGQYIITGVLGYGGFSVVYSAQSESDEKQVAIKEVIVNSGGTRASKDAILRQIVAEIELLKTLNHPNIVQCLDFFIDAGRIYIVLQALDGQNLRKHVNQNGPLQEQALIDIGLQSCSILSYLHTRSKPVMHRDFTPDNLIWDGHTVKLIDFNVAEEVTANSSQTIVGKHSFLAPEQWCGNFTQAGDLYQLGCSLYFLATGQDPEPLTQSNPAPLRPDLSEAFCSIVRKLTARECEDRYATASDTALKLQELKEALRHAGLTSTKQ
jgi:hypothetical protein